MDVVDVASKPCTVVGYTCEADVYLITVITYHSNLYNSWFRLIPHFPSTRRIQSFNCHFPKKSNVKLVMVNFMI